MGINSSKALKSDQFSFVKTLNDQHLGKVKVVRDDNDNTYAQRVIFTKSVKALRKQLEYVHKRSEIEHPHLVAIVDIRSDET